MGPLTMASVGQEPWGWRQPAWLLRRRPAGAIEPQVLYPSVEWPSHITSETSPNSACARCAARTGPWESADSGSPVPCSSRRRSSDWPFELLARRMLTDCLPRAAAKQ
jgi:hypothetical protein